MNCIDRSKEVEKESKPLLTYAERAKAAQEDRERYRVDNGKICECPYCHQLHYVRQREEK